MIDAEKIEENYADKYDLYKDLLKVHSHIKSDITSDIVLARFKNDKDKIYVNEMAWCGQYCKQLAVKILENYNEYSKSHGVVELTPNEVKIIQAVTNDIFSIFMNKISVLALLNRNEKDNYIVKRLTGYSDDDEQNEDETVNGESKLVKGIKKKLKNRENEDNE